MNKFCAGAQYGRNLKVRIKVDCFGVNEAPRSPAMRDLRFATTPFGGISVSLQQAARYSGEGE